MNNPRSEGLMLQVGYTEEDRIIFCLTVTDEDEH